MKKIHRSIFLKEIKDSYPFLRSQLNDQDGMFCYEVSVFLRFVQRNIDEEDHENTEILLARVNRYYSLGDKALVEHIRNGICEDVKFEDSKKHFRSWALKYLSPELRKERESWIKFMGPPT